MLLDNKDTIVELHVPHSLLQAAFPDEMPNTPEEATQLLLDRLPSQAVCTYQGNTVTEFVLRTE